MGLARNEIDREARATEFYEVLSSFAFMSRMPTLFNSGTLRSQLSSCYLTTVPDDLEGIYALPGFFWTRIWGKTKRWSAQRKKEVVLHLLRGEPVDAISREVSVPIYKLERWRDRALAGIEAGLKERDQAEGRRTPRSGGPKRSKGCGIAAQNDPLEKQLDEANRRIGKWIMEVEILRKERQARRP